MAKGPEAFRTISEASLELGVAQHVLRFWETRFSFIRPLKRAGGRRFYRPRDIAILATVRRLLHQEGYSIKGVQTLHREKGVNHLAAGNAGKAQPVEAIPGPALDGDRVSRLRASLAALEAAKARLDSLLAGR